MTKYFGTDGVRGIANKELSPEMAFRLGRTGGYVLTQHKEDASRRPLVLVARDTRISGQMLADALIAGLLSVGIEVLDLGVITTPAVAYLIKIQGAAAGVAGAGVGAAGAGAGVSAAGVGAAAGAGVGAGAAGVPPISSISTK